MPRPTLAIVIPVFHDIKQLGRCLSALHNSQHQDFSIIVVDHSESDDISRFIAVDYPNAIHLRGSPALWWSGATNLGIKHALDNDNQLLMLLNHDCFVRPETIGNLVKSIESSNQTIIAPVQRSISDGKLVITATSCFILGFPTIIAPQWWQKRKLNSTLQETELIIGGRGAIIPARIISKVGLFDQSLLPHYGADHDFYHRCRKRGIRLVIDTSAFVDIDDTHTSKGNFDCKVTVRSTLQSLRSRNSHRNIADMKALFHKQSALPFLAPVGMAFYIVRFLAISLFVSLLQKLSLKN